MKKYQLYGLWHKYKTVSLVVIMVGLVIFGVTAGLALRYNNLRMLELKEQVFRADEADGDTEAALIKLRNFMYDHMNTTMRDKDASEPPIQLANRFNKYLAEQQAILTAKGQPNIYAEAQANCEKANHTTVQSANCIQAYVTAKSTADNIELKIPPKEFYTFDFASAGWSPDLAGFSIIISIIFAILLVIRLVIGFIVKAYLH